LGPVEWTWGKRLGLDCRRRLLFPEEAERAGTETDRQPVVKEFVEEEAH